MKINLLIIALTFVSSMSFGQSTTTSNAKDTKWEVGLDILPIIKDTSYHMKESILIKRKLNENLKLRGRFGIYFDDVKNEETHEPKTDTIFGHRPRIYTSIGFEKKIFESKNVYVNSGVDGFLFYNRNKIRQHHKTVSAIPMIDTERFIDDIEVKTGINAFVNAEFLISNHFAINIESFWQFAYRRQRFFDEEYQLGQLAIPGGRTINRFVTQLQPISSINLIYKF
ncbi:MAG: hypothetical protein IT245_05900 [Bacteroidia bacterium]|nr:hypothetical protein [Bacteroidia bacterium]